LAKSRKFKEEILDQYDQWLSHSKALVVTEYLGMSMKELDVLRAKIREVGGEFHVVKNTLGRKAFEKAGYSFPEELLFGSSAIVFAFNDAPAVAKTVVDFAKGMEKLKVKGGILDKKPLSADGVKALADMPPLPVMRATLLGTIMAPASKLVRTMAEPGRSVAAVIKAYADRDAVSTAA
jgi:large subunit ribosomal protein L10